MDAILGYGMGINILLKLAITLLIGFLIGVEQERRKKAPGKTFAGVRTFPMISLFGFLAAFISSETTFDVYMVFFGVLGLLVSTSYYFLAKKGEMGATSELIIILVFLLGSLVFWGYMLLSGAIAVALVTLIALKSQFRNFAGKIEEEDIYATLKFGLITLIILPLLPDQAYGPFNVLNPRKIWYFVILIAGIGFVGYILFKLIETKKSIQILSILGGLASSTAVTLSFTQKSKEMKNLSQNFAGGIILASTIMFPRVLFIIYLLSPQLARALLIPFTIFTLVGVITSLVMWKQNKTHNFEQDVKLNNPFKILFAVKFGAIFAVIFMISAAAQQYFGDQGTLFTSFLAGFANLDAISLSLVNLSEASIALNVASVGIVIAAFSNTITKAVIAGFFGSKQLKKNVALGFGIILLTMLIYIIAII